MGMRKPLGFKGMTKRDLDWRKDHIPVAIIDVAKAVYGMNIAEDNKGYAYFNDVLFAALRRGFGYKLDGQKADDVPHRLMVCAVREGHRASGCQTVWAT